jgi:radical SAM superfamily enzyme YgiQ (UPF0313 family)
MSENVLRISSTSLTPDVFVDYDEKHAKIVGRSVPEDSYDFYFTITQKLKSVSDLTLELDFEYINSGSLRYITFAITSELNLKKVVWYYIEGDVDIEEKGRLIKDIMNKEHPEVEYIVKVK